MDRIQGDNVGPSNTFTEGDPEIPTAATTVTADWLNDVQEEICFVIEDAGLVLDPDDTTQLAQAITAMIAADLAAFIPTAAQKALDYIEVRDQKAAGTDGGGFTSGSWQTRDLNTEAHDTGNHASVGSNQITLAAGTYDCDITAPAGVVNNHQAKLRNVTDGADTLIGTSEYTGSGGTVYTRSRITGRFTIAAQKVFEVQHQCQTTKATDGYGNACNFGVTEIYTVARFWKVG